MEYATSSTVSWDVYPELSHEQFQACSRLGIEPMLAQLLHNRGITTPDTMRAFIDADYDKTPAPLTMIGMDKALARVQRAIEQREHITVYGDYDADGVTSSALLFRALRTLKHPDAILDFHIPSRIHDGCGLNLRAIDMLKERGTSLIITTDCASSDVEQIAYANERGIDVIITDHHHPPAELPAAYAMVNPWHPASRYGERYLCGVGVAFKLVQALYRASHRSQEDELALLDLVAIGTIADVAALQGENHTLVRLGLQQLNTTQKPGLQALIQKANLQPGKIRERDISYGLSPRINAAGRMGDASIAFRLLTTDSAEEAKEYVEKLDQLNQQRQLQTEELMNSVRQEADLRPNDKVVLVSGDGWPEGIIGLVAGKLSEEINRPVLVLSRGDAFSRGSARSNKGLNIIHALRNRADLFERYGGHAQAAGFTIANGRIEELRDYLLHWNGAEEETAILAVSEDSAAVEELADGLETVTTQESVTVPESRHMADLLIRKLENISYKTYEMLQQLAPFGATNPEPVFLIEGMRIQSSWVGGSNGRNLRLNLKARNFHFSATLIRGGARQPSFLKDQLVNVIFTLEPTWSPIGEVSKQSVWLKILHVEAVNRPTEHRPLSDSVKNGRKQNE
ncbi:MAG: single-stranded-DNA-specific exonuclease RecJ [Ktedonobacteraceae bacterium]